MPGAMAWPRYSPAAETALKVVAVPKSTAMQGPPYGLEGGDGVDDQVGADLARVAGEDGHAGLDSGADDQGLETELGRGHA